MKNVSANTKELIRTMNHYVDYRRMVDKWEGYNFCCTYPRYIHASFDTLIKLSKELGVECKVNRLNGSNIELGFEYDGLTLIALFSQSQYIEHFPNGDIEWDENGKAYYGEMYIE